MKPKLIELLREYWLLTAELDDNLDRGESGGSARFRLVEEEIRSIAVAENRCTFCLSDLGEMDSAEITDGICGGCVAGWTH
jgi:hypothetical protein